MRRQKKLRLTILRPGGNDTALVAGIPRKQLRKRINDFIMKRFPNVEQVGFYSYDANKKDGKLEMAGGEFCGNATRSLAYLLLNGRIGNITLKVSGTNQLLLAGVKRNGTAFSEMPIRKTLQSVRKISNEIWRIELDGITHLITPRPDSLSTNEYKNVANKMLSDCNLLSTSIAAGVIFTSQKYGRKQIDPIIWVRDIETFFYETACASGTIALGLVESTIQQKNLYSEDIYQPSGKCITAKVSKNSRCFLTGYIEGEIQCGGTYEI